MWNFNQKKRVPNGRRQSLRLQEAGYYRPDGTPHISYKERLTRIFKSRKPKGSDPKVDVGDFVQEPFEEPMTFFLPGIMGPVFIVAILTLLAVLPPDFMMKNARKSIHAMEADLMENFALLSRKATVIRSLSSSTYYRPGLFATIQSWFCSKHLWVLQPKSPLTPGKCWPFKGGKGQLHIQLSRNVHISHVTLGHIAMSQSPTGKTISAPQYFSVYGMKTLDGEEEFLGRFYYTHYGPAFQTFKLPKASVNEANKVFKHVRLKVESNWGNTEFTCLYNFRVHGEPESYSFSTQRWMGVPVWTAATRLRKNKEMDGNLKIQT